MNVRNCRMCGRIFNYFAGPFLCPGCREKMEEKFQIVKEYIRSNPGVSISEVSEACDVDKQQITQWLREERLELTEQSTIWLSCETCGTQIRSGRYCERCKATMTNNFRNAMRSSRPEPAPVIQKKEKDSDRMRFLN